MYGAHFKWNALFSLCKYCLCSASNHPLFELEFTQSSDKWDHNLWEDILAFLLHIQCCCDDGTSLHFRDLGIRDA